MSKLVNLNVTANELEIVHDIQYIGYGEMYNLVFINGPKEHNIDTTEKTKNFIDYLRKQEVIEKLIIHGGEPAYSEIGSITEHGHGCTIKKKF